MGKDKRKSNKIIAVATDAVAFFILVSCNFALKIAIFYVVLKGTRHSKSTNEPPEDLQSVKHVQNENIAWYSARKSRGKPTEAVAQGESKTLVSSDSTSTESNSGSFWSSLFPGMPNDGELLRDAIDSDETIDVENVEDHLHVNKEREGDVKGVSKHKNMDGDHVSALKESGERLVNNLQGTLVQQDEDSTDENHKKTIVDQADSDYSDAENVQKKETFKPDNVFIEWWDAIMVDDGVEAPEKRPKWITSLHEYFGSGLFAEEPKLIETQSNHQNEQSEKIIQPKDVINETQPSNSKLDTKTIATPKGWLSSIFVESELGSSLNSVWLTSLEKIFSNAFVISNEKDEKHFVESNEKDAKHFVGLGLDRGRSNWFNLFPPIDITNETSTILSRDEKNEYNFKKWSLDSILVNSLQDSQTPNYFWLNIIQNFIQNAFASESIDKQAETMGSNGTKSSTKFASNNRIGGVKMQSFDNERPIKKILALLKERLNGTKFTTKLEAKKWIKQTLTDLNIETESEPMRNGNPLKELQGDESKTEETLSSSNERLKQRLQEILKMAQIQDPILSGAVDQLLALFLDDNPPCERNGVFQLI
jgi:hypothetical protein